MMKPAALQQIHEEHRAVGAVLRALREIVDAACASARLPDFARLHAMLAWLDRAPARVHHDLEGSLLFPRIRERCPPLRPVLDRLEGEHKRGESIVEDLDRALTHWEHAGNARREPFAMLARNYVQNYLGHMEVEEHYVLPVALDYLSEADWVELNAAFIDRAGLLAESELDRHASIENLLASRHRHRPDTKEPCKTSKSRY